MSRTKAALIHLCVCVVVAVVLIAYLWYVLYPDPLLFAIGAINIFVVIIGADVVLGPTLTFIVYKAEKKTLRFDLSVILLIQTAALIYGSHALWINRPVFIAALGHRFDAVLANDVQSANESAELHNAGPRWVGTRPATEPVEKERMIFSALDGADYGHYPQYHQPIENMRDEILKNAQYIPELKKLNPGEEAAIDRWLEKRGVMADDVIYQGLKARAKDMAVIMDAKTAKVIGIAPFKPWP